MLVVYHYFHPDRVVSARIFSDLALEQFRRGWEVTALSSNRVRTDPSVSLERRGRLDEVRIERSFRPPWSQGRPITRLLNSAWLLAAWTVRATRLGRYDAIVIGSDPSFAALLALPLRLLNPRAAIAHWCLDVFPDAGEVEWPAVARPLAAPLRRLMGLAYRCCDVVVDLGTCMRRRLERCGEHPHRATLTPWALAETGPDADPELRRQLFGEAQLALLYSGSLSRSHDLAALLELARRCRARAGNTIAFCFAGTGTSFPILRAAVTPEDTNIRFAPFEDEGRLAERLVTADLHLASLRPDFTGIVVPSKFFAALAVGRPFLFVGCEDAAIARWIAECDVGFVGHPREAAATAEKLAALANDPSALGRWRRNAREAYATRFSKAVVNDRWSELLDEAVARRLS